MPLEQSPQLVACVGANERVKRGRGLACRYLQAGAFEQQPAPAFQFSALASPLQKLAQQRGEAEDSGGFRVNERNGAQQAVERLPDL